MIDDFMQRAALAGAPHGVMLVARQARTIQAVSAGGAASFRPDSQTEGGVN
jgi:hypothetical protein